MSCNGCDNGCLEIISDGCVKYMGPTIPSLGITSGDSLVIVEAAIIQYLLTALDGTGVLPVIDPASVCGLVDNYLPATPTLNDVIDAVFNAICDLQTQLTNVTAEVDGINSAYTVGCLTVIDNTDTHEVLQEVIDQLCATVADVTALTAQFNNYVLITDLDAYIAAYIAGNTPSSNLMSSRMVPYAAIEYYGDLTGKFDATGAGTGDWDKVYLCNGQHGTPDKRGRLPVGTIMPGGGPMSAVVDPAAGNPNYASPGQVEGVNSVTLTTNQMPTHSHAANTIVTDPGHKHLFGGDDDLYPAYSYKDDISFDADNTAAGVGKNFYTKNLDGSNTAQPTGISVSTSLTGSGGGQAHTNIPPVISCHYIMYIP